MGATWVSAQLQGSSPRFYDMVTIDFGQGSRAFAGGEFIGIGGMPVVGLAEWDGQGWVDPGLGFTSAPGQETLVSALGVTSLGGRVRLVLGGFLFHPNLSPNHPGGAYRGLVEWDGTTLVPLAATDEAIIAIEEFDPGTGARMAIAGYFSNVAGVSAPNVALWDGATWTPAGSSVYGGVFGHTVHSMGVFDEGQGERLFVGGNFVFAGGQPVGNLARWDGATWSAVGGAIGTTNCDDVYDLTVYDDGSGPAPYVMGRFNQAGPIPVSNIARWDGATWSDLGGGTADWVNGAAVHDEGDGAALFISGGYLGISGVPVCGPARYGPIRRPTVFIDQAGPGSPVYVQQAGLYAGSEYYNVFTADLCAGPVPGSGPLLGLCVTDYHPILAQVGLPVGAIPFHYVAAASGSLTFGPFTVPPMTLEFIALEFRNGILKSASHVARASIQ